MTHTQVCKLKELWSFELVWMQFTYHLHTPTLPGPPAVSSQFLIKWECTIAPPVVIFSFPFFSPFPPTHSPWPRSSAAWKGEKYSQNVKIKLQTTVSLTICFLLNPSLLKDRTSSLPYGRQLVPGKAGCPAGRQGSGWRGRWGQAELPLINNNNNNNHNCNILGQIVLMQDCIFLKGWCFLIHHTISRTLLAWGM